MALWQVVLVLVVVLLVLAIKYLPWWALVILIAIPILGWRYLGALLMLIMFRRTAREIGKSLRDASVTVNSLKAVPPPPVSELSELMAANGGEDDETFWESMIKDLPDEPPEARDWYELEVTIAPRPREQVDEEDGNPGWQPEALLLVIPSARRGEYDLACMIGKTEIEMNGAWRLAGDRYSFETERLRLLVGVQPGTKAMRFRYFFENFGEPIELPPPYVRPAPATPA